MEWESSYDWLDLMNCWAPKSSLTCFSVSSLQEEVNSQFLERVPTESRKILVFLKGNSVSLTDACDSAQAACDALDNECEMIIIAADDNKVPAGTTDWYIWYQ